MKQAYWCGWNVPDNLPEDDLLEAWPKNMKGWCTGYGEDYSTHTGVVIAESAEAARAVVLSCYGVHAGEIEERWEPDALTNTDLGDRFPGGTEWVAEALADG